MTITAEGLNAMVDAELVRLTDARVMAHIRSLRVEPKPILRNWDYGRPGEQYPCWAVLDHEASNTGIAYCESGFGPKCPWGLVLIGGNESRRSIGMDSGWYPHLLDAYFESYASAELPIWRVFKGRPWDGGTPITEEGSWDETWAKVSALRETDPTTEHNCWHSITY